MVEDMQGTPTATDVVGLSQRMTDFVTTVRQDTDKIYGRLDDAHDDRSLMSDQVNLLRRDRRANARTTRLMESEARISREAWVQSMDASDTARSEVIALWTTVLAQQTKIGDLRSHQTPTRDPAHLDVPEKAGSTDIANITRKEPKPVKNEHEKERVHKSRELSSFGQ
ncbi:hypothetical protein Tco_1538044 [Tanacetum coccineum]